MTARLTTTYWPGVTPYQGNATAMRTQNVLPATTNTLPVYSGSFDIQKKIDATLNDAPEHNKGIVALGIVKMLFGGFLVGGTVATIKKLKLPYMVATDMFFAFLETLLAKWILQSNNPIAQHILSFSSKMTPHGSKKPVRQMTNHEKELALTSVSILVALAGDLSTLKIGDKLEGHPRVQSKPVSPQEIQQATGIRKALKWSKFQIHNAAEKISVPSAIKETALFKKTVGGKYGNIIKVVCASLLVGTMEGILAGYLKRHEEKNEKEGKKSITSLFLK